MRGQGGLLRLVIFQPYSAAHPCSPVRLLAARILATGSSTNVTKVVLMLNDSSGYTSFELTTCTVLNIPDRGRVAPRVPTTIRTLGQKSSPTFARPVALNRFAAPSLPRRWRSRRRVSHWRLVWIDHCAWWRGEPVGREEGNDWLSFDCTHYITHLCSLCVRFRASGSVARA